MVKLAIAAILAFLVSTPVFSFDFVIVKYKTGDWYNNRDSVRNFLAELAARTVIPVNLKAFELSLDESAVFEHYFLFLNGHVPLRLSDREKSNLRKFVLNGGFVFVNDDYGLDESFRKLAKEVFPEYPLQEVDFKNDIYHCFYDFTNGIPKIHEHDGGPGRGYGIFVNGRIALYYAFDTDIGDGWDLPEVHNDPPEKREEAFRMGVNIVVYSLTR